jgi:RNA-directed DNA polymerase
MNVALHGLEEAAGVRYLTNGVRAGDLRPESPTVIRYADDLVALCHSQEQARQVKARLAAWLAPRGLVFNEDKTQIVHLSQGFDFLGFNIRRYSSGKLLVKPSKAAVKRLRARLAAEVRALRGWNALAVVTKLNPIIKGWAAYYRSAVSGRVFASLDNYLWQLLYKWSTWSHHDKPKRWIVDRYFGKRNKFRNDHWVFGAPGTGAYVVKFAWTDIVRHTMVKGGASPDDPELAEYWANRRRRVQPPLDGYTVRLLARQDARCPLCGAPLLLADQPPESPDQWERWWLQLARKAISADYLVHHAHHGRPGARPDNDHTRLVHASCKRGQLARRRRGQHKQPTPESPLRLA